ncbi:MAG: acyl-CoA thioesterase [Croceivirga sp.]
MSPFEKTITVGADDLDELKHVNNIRYLEWVQDISRAHWLNTVDQKNKEELIWVVRRHDITYYDSAILGDTIHIATQVIAWKGPISVRQVTMKNNKSGKNLVMATTEWCALDAKTRRPVRVPKEIQRLFIKDE